MSAEPANQRYRLFAYLALLVGFASVAVAWRANRELADNLGMVDLSAIAEGRDVKYAFTRDAYGFRYSGVTGNVLDEQIILFGLYEKDRLYFMRDYLQNAKIENSVVIDGGANAGNHSLFLSQHAAKVHAFEPFPPVIERFRENLRLNPQIGNIDLHEVGLGDKEAELPFVEGPAEEMGGGSFRGAREDEPGYSVRQGSLKVVTADDWLKNRETGPVALVKLDVEGFEEPVLRGMRGILDKHRPLVVVEVSPPPIGTVATIEQLRALFPADYDFLVFENVLDAALNGRYEMLPLSPDVFGSKLRVKLDVVAFPRERTAAVPR